MAKRAVLVGCNYPGTNNSLNGCVNDVHSMRRLLIEKYGFPEEDIVVLVDTDPEGLQPTGANVKKKLADLVSASAAGDSAVLHFSGHGTQVPSDRQEETDALDEAICPTDMNLITDDDLRAILLQLADGVKFTMVADCCHSGTLLDQTVIEISGPKSDDPDPPALLADTFSAAAGEPDAREVASRSLSYGAYLQMLSERVGFTVEPGQVRAALVAAFHSDAPVKYASVLNHLVGAAAVELGIAEEDGHRGLFGDSLGSLLGALGGKASEEAPPAGQCATQRLPPGKGILITGCQSHETSADACPSGDPAQAFGALTNALTTVANAFKDQYPDANISYRTLVSNVRDVLEQSRFAQNPCLECDDANADSGIFVVA